MAEGRHYFIVKRSPRSGPAPRGNEGKPESRFRLFLQRAALGLGAGLVLVAIVWVIAWFYRPGPTKFNTVTVSGKVLLDGQPLTKGRVMFHADATKGNTTRVVPAGDIDSHGNYVLYTGNSKGAPPGWYRVTVLAMPETETREKGKPLKAPFNEKSYSQDERTPLRVEVKQNAGGDSYTLQLKSK
jgi:hypothetical protein